MTDELVHLDIDAGIATITLDSPGNRNALSAQLRGELRDRLDTAIKSDQARVIVLTHTGTVFCAGMDLKESRGANAASQGVKDFPDTLRQIWDSPTPVIAKLAGPARAGGVGLVAACDLAVAVEQVTFAFTEVRIGVVPAVISVPLIPRVQPAALYELFRYAEMLRLGAPSALAATKELLRGPASRTMGEDLAAMTQLSAARFASEEGQEGIRAFVEKRPPSWAAR